MLQKGLFEQNMSIQNFEIIKIPIFGVIWV